MNYIIIESQTTDGVTAVIKTVKPTYETAEQEYHTKLAYAAVSNVPLHAVTMLTENGKMVTHQCYDHRAPATEEEETE